MADAERDLLAKVASGGGLERLLAEGVRPDHFAEKESQEIWEFMTAHLRRFGQQPSIVVVRQKFPDHDFRMVTDSLDYLKEQFCADVLRREAIEHARMVAEIVDEQPDEWHRLDQIILENARRMSQVLPTTSVERFSHMPDRILEYERGAGKMGIRMGIPLFDELTMGIQPHEYITIAGWQGTGKSTLAQWALFNAYQAGETPMYVSLEMEARALFRKWDTMLMHFKYRDLKSGNLSDRELVEWRKKARDVSQAQNDIVVIDDVRDCSVDKVYGEIVRHKPSICVVDYISLMQAPKSAGSSMWERVTYLTQQLKAAARNLKVPIIGVAQTNIDSAEKGADLTNISYSRSIGQDSDLVFGLWRDQEMRDNRQMEVRLLKNRDGEIGKEKLLWDMSDMTFEVWGQQHLFNGKRTTVAPSP